MSKRVPYCDMSMSAYRDGCDELLRELHDHKVPVLIFSAGIGDIIERVVKQQAHMYSNIKIVSNYMDFNNQVHISCS